MLEPARPVVRFFKLHPREFCASVQGKLVAGFLQNDCNFSVRTEFQEAAIDVGHEGVAL